MHAWRADLLEHLCEVDEFLDVCITVGFSLGLCKMVLAKPQVKLLREYVGRLERMPDPGKVKAIKEWGSMENLKELQEFLGTCNYSRHVMGLKYARAAEPLHKYIKGTPDS